MDIRATKDHAEREDEEAARLIREAPKDKPSRHDKKRERMNTDSESDPDLGGKDMSLNHKVVGSVAARFLVAKGERIPVVRKDTGERALVSPKTLKEKASLYERLKPDDIGPDPDEKPAEEEKPSKPKKPKKAPAAPEAPAEGEAPAQSEQAPASPAKPEKKPKKQKAPKDEKPKEAPAGEAPAEQEKPEKEPSVEDKLGIGAPKRREASAAEKQRMMLDLTDHLPPKLAAQVIAEGIHPDDAKTLIDSYKAASARSVGNPQEFASKVADIYTTDSKQVKPPAK